MKFKAVFFDLGSTLIDFENHPWDELGRMGCRNACAILKNELNHDISAEKLWGDFHYAIDMMFMNHTEDLAEIDLHEVTSGILTKLGVTMHDGFAGRFIDAYYQPITKQISLCEGADAILTRLKDAGLTVGLISNTIFPARFHRSEMEKFGILKYFDFTIFSSEFKMRKPKRDIFLKALELAGCEASETVFIGDRLVEDIGGPQALGIKGILKHTADRDYSASIVPHKTIRSLHELDGIILS